MKSDIGHYYDTTPVIDMNCFAELFLICFALNNEKNPLTAELPNDYKDGLKKVMESEGENLVQINTLIDPNLYYERPLVWEMELAKSLKKYIDNNRDIELSYNFYFDNLIIKYSKEKALRIVSKYDKDTIYVMRRITDYVKEYSQDQKRYNEKIVEDTKQYIKNV